MVNMWFEDEEEEKGGRSKKIITDIKEYRYILYYRKEGQTLLFPKEYRLYGRKAREGLFLIANFSPRIRSVAPKPQMTKFEFLARKIKHKFLWTSGPVLNFLGMIEVVPPYALMQQT